MTEEAPTLEELKQALWIFRLKPGASLEEIKKRKAFLMKTMHEDVVAENLKEAAREELIQINASWEVIDRWFKANPGQARTPEESVSDDDPEDWENWKKQNENRWSSSDASLQELDNKRRRDIIVSARREFVIKSKYGIAAVILIGMFLMPVTTIGFFSLWNIALVAYLIWLFHPKAKAATEKWIEME